MKKNIIFKIFCIILSFSLWSCEYELKNGIDFYEEKILISGYVASFDSPSVVRIQKTVPINSTEQYAVVKNAKITLFEQNPANKITQYAYTLQGEEYITKEKALTKNDHTYWIEVTMNNKTYKSTPVKAVNTNSKVSINKKSATLGVMALTLNSGAFTTYQKGYFDPAKAIDRYEYFAGKWFRGSGATIDNDFTIRKDVDYWVYVVEIPQELDDFYDQWVNSKSNLGGDPYSTPGANNRPLFTENGQIPNNILGAFFPCFGHKIAVK